MPLCSPSSFIKLKTPGPNYEPKSTPTDIPNCDVDPIYLNEGKKERHPFFSFWFKHIPPNKVIEDDELFWFNGEPIEGDYFRTDRDVDEYFGLEPNTPSSPDAEQSFFPSTLRFMDLSESEVGSSSGEETPAWNALSSPDWSALPLEPLPLRHRSTNVSLSEIHSETSTSWAEGTSPNWDSLPLPRLETSSDLNSEWSDEKNPDWNVLPLPSYLPSGLSDVADEANCYANASSVSEFEILRPISPVSLADENSYLQLESTKNFDPPLSPSDFNPEHGKDETVSKLPIIDPANLQLQEQCSFNFEFPSLVPNGQLTSLMPSTSVAPARFLGQDSTSAPHPNYQTLGVPMFSQPPARDFAKANAAPSRRPQQFPTQLELISKEGLQTTQMAATSGTVAVPYVGQDTNQKQRNWMQREFCGQNQIGMGNEQFCQNSFDVQGIPMQAIPRVQVDINDFTCINIGNKQLYVHSKPLSVVMDLVGGAYLVSSTHLCFMCDERGFWTQFTAPHQTVIPDAQAPTQFQLVFPNTGISHQFLNVV